MKKLVALLAVVTGCTSVSLPRPKDPLLARGRDRYVSRCAGCHSLPDPRSERRGEWRAELDVMAPKAKLTPDERDAVERYLLSLAPS